jgi:site-specific DNA-methyltransferase (adenine-specific)
MIFRKLNPMPQIYRKRYTNEFEYMFVFTKGRILTHNPIMVDCKHVGSKPATYKNYSKNEQKRTKIANKVKSKKIRGNIWDYSVGVNSCDKEALPHPAPYPCKLAEEHLLSWSNEGDIVLDPFMGSGTTGIMAKLLNRNFIGIEKDETYCNIAVKRVREHKAVTE